MFNEDADTGNHLILRFIFSTAFVISGLFLWLIGHDMGRFKPLEACILKERTAWRKAIAFLITNAFIVHASSIGATEVGCLNRPSAVDRFLDSSRQSRFSHVRWPNIFNQTRGLLAHQMRPILIPTTC